MMIFVFTKYIEILNNLELNGMKEIYLIGKIKMYMLSLFSSVCVFIFLYVFKCERNDYNFASVLINCNNNGSYEGIFIIFLLFIFILLGVCVYFLAFTPFI